ncbi:MAG: hypothetical protein JWQ16_1184 [Novosphingobium sp.]|nr:hypothetical protein [Novosphingobium sp.]
MNRLTLSLLLAGVLIAPAPTHAAPAPERTSQYTRTDKCRQIEFNEDEGGWSVQRCPGLAGYRLRLTEGDLRQNIVVELPRGGERSLDLAGTTGSGGFSSIGPTVEWRGPRTGTGTARAFRPDALILRYAVVENQDHPEQPTSYLLTVSLANRRPCVTAKVPPGPGQNDRARSLADAPMRCLP